MFVSQNTRSYLMNRWTITGLVWYLFECIFHAESKYGNNSLIFEKKMEKGFENLYPLSEVDFGVERVMSPVESLSEYSTNLKPIIYVPMN